MKSAARSLAAIFLLTLATAQEPAEAPSEGPDRAAVRTAVADLEAAFDGDEVKAKLDALLRAIDVPHAEVVKAVAVGLDDTDEAVRGRAAEALGRIDLDEALETLHAYAKKHRKKLPDDPAWQEALYKEIGRHGDVSSVELLADRLFVYQGKDPALRNKVTITRILALGNIRDTAALAALFEQMKSADQRLVQNQFPHLRLSLMLLSGIDHGVDYERWTKWWREKGADFVVAKPEPKLPDEYAERWRTFWGRERTYERKEDRARRGQDPEGSGGGERGGKGDAGAGRGKNGATAAEFISRLSESGPAAAKAATSSFRATPNSGTTAP